MREHGSAWSVALLNSHPLLISWKSFSATLISSGRLSSCPRTRSLQRRQSKSWLMPFSMMGASPGVVFEELRAKLWVLIRMCKFGLNQPSANTGQKAMLQSAYLLSERSMPVALPPSLINGHFARLLVHESWRDHETGLHTLCSFKTWVDPSYTRFPGHPGFTAFMQRP